MRYFWDVPFIDALTFHFSSAEPDKISQLLHPAQRHQKILQSNEGSNPYTALSAATRGAWGFFAAGGHYAFYEDDSRRIGSAAWTQGATRLKVVYEWYDPRDGRQLRTGTVTGGGLATLPAPSPPTWSAQDGLVLVIRVA
jgi:hypothetical protein